MTGWLPVTRRACQEKIDGLASRLTIEWLKQELAMAAWKKEIALDAEAIEDCLAAAYSIYHSATDQYRKTRDPRCLTARDDAELIITKLRDYRARHLPQGIMFEEEDE